LSGYTKVGNLNFFSLNVVTIPNISIGDNNVIAPNMVIEKNILSDTTFFHRFKEVVLVVPKIQQE
jgi:acetyltransferase-like isoleucine patch superfamily enzyme